MSHIPARNGPLLDVATLLGDDSEPFEDALSDDAEPALAVVGQPFGGRETVLDSAEHRLDARRLDVGSTDDLGTVLDAVGSEPLVVDGCQHLYTREVGGFEPLAAFLDALANADAPVVTGWNSYAWSYLTAVRGVDATIPTAVTVEGLSREQLTEFVRSSVDTLPTFRRDDLDESLVTARPCSVRGDWTLPIPVPNREAIEARRTDRPSPREAVFERLTTASVGNPGVALALFEQARPADGAMRPSDITLPGKGLDPGREAAFFLRIVLATERVSREWLEGRFGDPLDRWLGRFVREGLLARDGDTVVLQPGGVPTAAQITGRRNVL